MLVVKSIIKSLRKLLKCYPTN